MEPPKSPSKVKFSILRYSKQRWASKVGVIVLVMVFLLLGLYLALNHGNGHAMLKESYYTVVVDCGSTGTRVNVYEWMIGGVSRRNLPILLHSYPDNTKKSPFWKHSCQYHCFQTEPGLDKFVGNSTGISASLEPLLTWAEKLVPHERRADTPIFVLATAGLRRLAVEDANQVLEDLEAVIKGHLFMHRKSWIRVLSGSEETYYGWVALNYKMGIFGNYSSSPTLGLLDLGGSSLQVVMEIDERSDDMHIIRSKLGSIESRILAYSLPAFGLNEAFDRTVMMLSHNQSREITGYRSELRHPCLSSDFVQNYTCYSCSGLDVNNQENHAQLQKDELPSFYLVGDQNWDQCKEIATAAAINSSTINFSRPAVGKNGSGIINLNAVGQPTTRFHALSGFFVVYNMLDLSPKANLTKLWDLGQQLCSESQAGLSSISANPNYAGHFCFRLPFMTSLIENALCLGDTDIIFGPGDVSWTLGAALVEGKFLWLNATANKAKISILTSKHVESLSSPIFLFAVLLCLLLVVYHSQMKLPMLDRRESVSGSSLPSYVYGRRQSNQYLTALVWKILDLVSIYIPFTMVIFIL